MFQALHDGNLSLEAFDQGGIVFDNLFGDLESNCPVGPAVPCQKKHTETAFPQLSQKTIFFDPIYRQRPFGALSDTLRTKVERNQFQLISLAVRISLTGDITATVAAVIRYLAVIKH
jgi:hypothetical protein